MINTVYSRIRKKTIGVLCIVLCAALIFMPAVNIRADDDLDSQISETKRKIEESESEIQNARTQKGKLDAGLSGAKELVESLKGSRDDAEAYISELDAGMEEIQGRITELDERISANEIRAEEAEEALRHAEEVCSEQYEEMKQHIRYMYTAERETFVGILATASGMGDLLNKNTYIEALSSYDDKKLAEYQETVNAVEERRKELEEAREELTRAKDEQMEEAASMQILIDAKQEEVYQYNAEIDDKEAQVAAYQNLIAEQNAQIAALEAALAEQKRILAEQNQKSRSYDGGMFTFPCPSYTRVSDDYGTRMHPTLHVKMMHNGIDLAAPSGSPILAAYDGTVVAASYSSSMGNYVMIDHGDGLITVYMHASKLLVSSGEEVSAGQKIALVGSTGRSTGPHLHFGVRKNGSYVNPWNYLK